MRDPWKNGYDKATQVPLAYRPHLWHVHLDLGREILTPAQIARRLVRQLRALGVEHAAMKHARDRMRRLEKAEARALAGVRPS